MTSRTNPLDLSFAELDVIRDLRASVHRVPENDPIWQALEQLGLAELGAKPDKGRPRHMLTLIGLRYRTD